ncbi:hypothetical protein SORBI_3005G055150 [Sorghum bicolor]|nr:hypothetical protein SORBI_3005G055150 [Sorghum bicolor]
MERCQQRKIQRLSIHVDLMRTTMVALYRMVGFQIDSTIEGYYAPHKDACRMYFDQWSTPVITTMDIAQDNSVQMLPYQFLLQVQDNSAKRLKY